MDNLIDPSATEKARRDGQAELVAAVLSPARRYIHFVCSSRRRGLGSSSLTGAWGHRRSPRLGVTVGHHILHLPVSQSRSTSSGHFFGQYELISQNALQKRHREKRGMDHDSDEFIGCTVAAGAEVANETKSVNGNKERKRKKAKDLESKEKEKEKMRHLATSLFGACHTPSFFLDRSAGDGVEDLPVYENLSSEDERNDVDNRGRKPAWVDDEDERTEVDITKVAKLRKLREEAGECVISGKEYEARLRGHHAKLNPFAGWADMDQKAPVPGLSDGESDEEGGVDDILQNNDELVVKDNAKLLPDMLRFSRLIDGNAQGRSSGPINSVQFHRNGQLMLVAGLDKHLRFFQIDGKRNPKIQSIYIEGCPIHKASFLPDGSELIGTLKMNGNVRSLAFADGGNQLLSSGGDGHVC
ncbi:hypothetical protein GUJ93_ZPchr0007g5475 [Zizania palustris]|uniref:Uncharacterized protein n=1 Tax=Zizania palustris TaxID=103762 RepID=A0A8J5W6E4_ZIZPA|nr:hypothetical protein GUJ93_ZPchr0007g5475 [Zizania palustris]